MRSLAAEFLGTFFLMLTILVVVLEEWPYPALIIGAILTVLVYLTGPISNAHLNPAITIGFWVRRRIPIKQVFTYIFVQIAGTLLAVWIIEQTIGVRSFTAATVPETNKLIVGEAIGTALLASVIWTVATLKRTAGNWYYGIAIGGIVAVGIVLFGEMSGAYFNPSTVLSCWMVGLTSLDDLPLLLTTILLASILSALLFNELEKIVDN